MSKPSRSGRRRARRIGWFRSECPCGVADARPQGPSVTLRICADLFESDLDAVAVDLDAKIADSVQSACRPSPPAPESRGLAAAMRREIWCPRGDLNPHAR